MPGHPIGWDSTTATDGVRLKRVKYASCALGSAKVGWVQVPLALGCRALYPNAGVMPRGPHGRPCGGQGVAREGESEGLAEQFRAVIEMDEPVCQSQGAVEPARWRRRRVASPLAHQGVCGRHGTEDFRVTPGDLGACVPVRGR